jgi:hypothetical protein
VAVVVGEAAVRIRPDVDGKAFRSEVEPEVSDALEDAGGSGAAKFAAAFGAALAIGEAFSASLEQAALGDKLAAQLGTTGARSEELGKVAGDLYAGAWGDSLEDVNTAVGAVVTSIDGMRNAAGADIEAATATALNFATAFDQDVTESVGVAGNLIKNGLAPDAEGAFDLMTAAYQRVPAAMRDELPAILTEYGTNFRALGFEGEDAFGLIVDAAGQGPFVLDKLGDALKEFTIRGSDMSKTSVAAYESIGLSADDMSNKIASGGPGAQDALQKTAEGILAIEDPATRANTAIALFGTPLEDLSVDQIPAFLTSLTGGSDAMEGFQGAAGRMGDTLNDNASTNLTSFMRTAQQAFVDIVGGQVVPIIEAAAALLSTTLGPAIQIVSGIVTDYVIPAFSSMGQWIADNQTPIAIIAGLIAALFIPHLIALGVQAGIARARVVASWIAQQAATIAAAVVHSAQIAWMIIRWVAMGAAAVLNAGITIGSWVGMGIVAVAQAGIVAAAWLGAQIRTVASLAVMAGQFVIQGAVMAVQAGLTAARVVASWVIMGAQSLLQAARMAAAWFIALGPVGWIIATIIGLVALIIANWDKVKTFTVNAFRAVVDFVVGAWRGLVNTVSSGISNVISFVSGLPGRILRGIGNLGSLLVGVGGDLMRGLVNGISAAASFVGNVARNIVNGIIGFINSKVIDGINGLLEFSIAGITINPPDIPHIPRLHSGGVFDSGTGEGLALLRDDELVATPEQRAVADDLLRGLLAGRLPAARPDGAAAVAGTNVQIDVHGAPGMNVGELSAQVGVDLGWQLSARTGRPVPVLGGAT